MSRPRFDGPRFLQLLACVAALSGSSLACSDGGGGTTGGGGGGNGGSSPTGADDPCALSLALSGAVAWQTSGQALSCVSSISTGSTFQLNFLPDRGSQVSALGLAVAGTQRGEIAANLSTVLVMNSRDGRSFSALGCRSTLTVNGFVRSEMSGDRYHVAGTSSCSSAAVSSGGEQTEVSPFQFDSTVIWNP